MRQQAMPDHSGIAILVEAEFLPHSFASVIRARAAVSV
jgi:hypothetical protein